MINRRASLLAFVSIAAASVNTAQAAAYPSKDRRLIGKWRLDRDRTLKSWSCDLESKGARTRYAAKADESIVEITETHIIESSTRIRYRVVASDDSAVVIALQDGNRETLQQFIFDGLGYYVLDGYHLKFFTEIHG